MAKKLQLTIPEPCHENWDKMTPVEQGRFCASCQKQVVDFTRMSDRQLAIFFKKPILSLSKDGSVCGRFQQDQLDREMEIPKKRIPWVKYFFQFALPAFLMSAKVSAQGKVRVTGDTVIVPSQTNVTLGMVAMPACEVEKSSVEKVIHGKITDEKNIPLPYASIMIKRTNIGMAADSNGIFKLDKVLFKKSKNIVLEISSTGFETKEIIISKEADFTQDLIIQLMPTPALQEVIVAASAERYTKGMVTGSVSRVTCTKLKETLDDKPFGPMIKIYPNPVLSGTSINVGCEKLKEGYYSIQLLNQSGQQIFSKQTWIDAEAQVLNIDIPSVAVGAYFLKLTNKKSGKNFTEKIIIE